MAEKIRLMDRKLQVTASGYKRRAIREFHPVGRRHPTYVSALDISSVPNARLAASIDRHHLDVVTAPAHDLDEHERSIAGVDSLTIN
jgi:hypothetical protein